MSIPELEETITKLSADERLQIMEVLWDAMRNDEPDSPAWHGEILAERLAKAEAGEARFFTLDEARKRLGR